MLGANSIASLGFVAFDAGLLAVTMRFDAVVNCL